MRRERPRCVHCLQAEGVTDDHGIPLSWYPDASKKNVPKPKAPSCKACNGRLKLFEEEVLVPFILSVAQDDPRAAGIAARVLRSIEPALARDESDRRSRLARRNRLFKSFVIPTSDLGAFPGAGHEGHAPVAMHLRGAALEAVAEKITRVFLYARFQKYVPAGHQVQLHVIGREDEGPLLALFKAGERIDIPPGVSITLLRAVDDPTTFLTAVDLWGQVRFYTSTASAS